MGKVQTTKTANMYFPDGALFSIKAPGDAEFFDVGAIGSAITNTLNWDENQIETANAGKTKKQIKNMTMSGGFTLLNLDPVGVQKLSGGFLKITEVDGTPFTDAPDQTVLAGNWADKAPIELAPTTTALISVRASALALTSVTASVSGALTEGVDYELIKLPGAFSGWGILLIVGTNLATINENIVIDFGSITPIASQIVSGGSSTVVLEAVEVRITHTDENGLKRTLDLYAVEAASGGFQFNFKGANEEGLEEMPLTYTARLNTARENLDQLFSWTVEAGAA